MIVIPYRAKNRPDHFPYATTGLIGANLVVFACTTKHLLVVTPAAIDALAFSHNEYSLLRVITAMFLHANILHVLVNMLFLWVFGGSVEGRLGSVKFLLIYFTAGGAGTVLEDLVVFPRTPDAFIFGASGATMGLAGAYLFIFPFSTICLYFVPFGKAMWHARWLILFFAVLDIVEQLVSSGSDGVAHLAHLGGFAVGLAGAALCRPSRDSLETSDAQAVRSDTRNLGSMSLEELEALMTPTTEDTDTTIEYLNRLLLLPPGCWDAMFQAAIRSHGKLLFRKADPLALAQLLLDIPRMTAEQIPGHFYLQLGARLDTAGSTDQAVTIYSEVVEMHPGSLEAEAALARMGWLMESRLDNPSYAHWYYSELIRCFPNSPLADRARTTISRMQQSGRFVRQSNLVD